MAGGISALEQVAESESSESSVEARDYAENVSEKV